MPDYRTYLRNSAAPFDGTTPEGAIYKKTGSYTFETVPEDISPVGSWDPLSIGRSDVISLISVASNVATDAADTYEHRSANNTLIQSVAFTPQMSIQYLLWPTDKIAINSSVSNSVKIAVQDLSNEQYLRYINSQNIANALAASTGGDAIITADNIISLANTTGRTTVYKMTGGAAQTITITPLVSTTVGTTLLIWNSTGTPHSVIPTATDLIMGVNAPIFSTPNSVIRLTAAGTTMGWILESTP